MVSVTLERIFFCAMRTVNFRLIVPEQCVMESLDRVPEQNAKIFYDTIISGVNEATNPHVVTVRNIWP